MKKYSAALLMAAFALVSVIVHVVTGWYAFVEEASSHGEIAQWEPYLIEWTRQTFENWQSEFVQLAVQMALLAGCFRFLGVSTYEEDAEQIKRRLDQMAIDVAEIRGDQR